jgi:hypothetical protein
MLHAREKVLGPEDPRVLAAKLDLAWTYFTQYRLQDSEKLAVQARKYFKCEFGRENIGYMFATDALGAIYRDSGRVKDAEELLIEGIKSLRSNSLGSFRYFNPHSEFGSDVPQAGTV